MFPGIAVYWSKADVELDVYSLIEYHTSKVEY